jgi:hypothetical protein
VSRLFDTVVVVDWSAATVPSSARPSGNAIWIGVAGEAPRYLRTRAEAMAWLDAFLRAEAVAGRRVLAGFDFAFGYPRGFASALTGRAEALAVWARLATLLRDGPDNANNRFAVAAAINAGLPGTGPFWGRPDALDLPGLPPRGSARAGHGLPERRLVEAVVPRAQPVWKLYTAGSVGGQALTGIAALEGLRRRLGGQVAVWPFETGLTVPRSARIVLAEVYPSLLAPQVALAEAGGEIRDAAQVRLTATALARLDAAGALGALFVPDLPAAERVPVAREEGWILGAGEAARLRAAA